ncbi:MAG: gamma-glutamylcyclotransferase family protein [Geminicoccaceae bacterium]
MTYFFFGTLMDLDVLATVLDRPVAGGELRQAWLHGYRRVRAASASYPVLVPAPRLVVGGVLFHPRGARDEVRIRHFEDEEYVDRWLIARLPDGHRQPARVFFALEALGCTEQPWHLATWAQEHKAAFLEQCREWLRDCPACGPDPSADPSADPIADLEPQIAAGWRRSRQQK